MSRRDPHKEKTASRGTLRKEGALRGGFFFISDLASLPAKGNLEKQTSGAQPSIRSSDRRRVKSRVVITAPAAGIRYSRLRGFQLPSSERKALITV